jgi:hypothetical protein
MGQARSRWNCAVAEKARKAREAMYYGAERKREGTRALLSVVAIAAGVVLSNTASTSAFLGSTDVEGVWRWVSQTADEQAQVVRSRVFEIRRDADGQLRATIAARSGAHVDGAEVSFDDGHICMITDEGASFSGEISEDGSLIHGVIEFGGARQSALLERVDRPIRKTSARLSAHAT